MVLFPVYSYAELPVLQHDLEIEFDHKNRTFAVRDQITFHDRDNSEDQIFPDLSLNPDLRIESIRIDGKSVENSYNNGIIDFPDDTNVVELIYSGELDDPQSPYIVWLPGDGWFPEAADHRVQFSLSLKADPQWSALTQGIPITQGGDAARQWDQTDPQEGIFFVLGPWQRYSKELDGKRANVLLIEPDPELAERYLDATLRYLDEFNKLIGPYPYHSFSLVENVRQTGWGMPGFTLLGSQLIRFPFILHTSYPHEILHNWWGNGVFTDASFGNWSEGLTSYLSDYRSRELRGEAKLYRLNTLIRWHDFAAEKADFPLVNFLSRHDRATQAVGYGKGMFLFHMLRQQLGDDVFFSGLRRLYAKYKFRYTNFYHLQLVFEQVCECDLNGFFKQWLNRTGAPEISLDSVNISTSGSSNSLRVKLSQHRENPWDVLVPIHTLDKSGKRLVSRVQLNSAEQVFQLDRDTPVERVEIDPDFDLFRVLDPGEKPITMSTIFSARTVAVMAIDESFSTAAKQLAEGRSNWRERNPSSTEIDSSEALVMLGWNPGLVKNWLISSDSDDYSIESDSVEIDQTPYPMDSTRVIAMTTEINVNGRNKPVLWIATRNSRGVTDLIRRLSHYGQFSWAVFDLPEDRANKTGQWKPKSGSLAWELR